MARRHFDEKGHPRLDFIIQEIRKYVEGLKVEHIDFSPTGNIIDPREADLEAQVLLEDIAFIEPISEHPFRVTGIYVIGGQVDYLPERYNVGDHDLDLVVTTNADSINSSGEAGNVIHLQLDLLLTEKDPEEQQGESRQFLIDLYYRGKERKLGRPYLQIYPEMRKFE